MAFKFIPNMGIGGNQPNPLPQRPTDNRSYYTGTIDTSANGPNDSGYGSDAGPKLGPSGYQVGQGAYGVVPIGGYSQLGGRTNGAYSGTYTGGPGASFFVPPGTQLPGEGPVPNYYGGNAAPHVPNGPSAPAGNPAPHVPDPGEMSWGGGFGTSDNSAWGNALGPTYEKSVGGGPLQTAGYQPQGHTNQALPMGYGSVFGLGGGR